MGNYRLTGGRLITDRGIVENDLLIRGTKIVDLILPEDSAAPDYQIIDCRGLYISPGFVDIHQHGGGGSDYMDDDPDAYLNATEAHLRHGTTSVMPTLLSADEGNIHRAVDAYLKATRDPRIRANLLGIHVEGPYISAAQAGAQKPEHIRDFDSAEYERIWQRSQGHIKRWSVAPEVAGAEEFARFAKNKGICLSIAHSNAELATVEEAFMWGFRHITHFYSCISTITRKGGFRVPGVLEAGYFIEDMNVELIADGCHLPLSLLQYVCKFKAYSNIALVTDAMRAAGQEVSESFLGSMDDPLPVVIEDGVAKLQDRSAFAGSIATADRLVANMVTAGLPLQAAVRMMTVNPLRMMGIDLPKGQICKGYDADLCVFDDDISVSMVICMGEFV